VGSTPKEVAASIRPAEDVLDFLQAAEKDLFGYLGARREVALRLVILRELQEGKFGRRWSLAELEGLQSRFSSILSSFRRDPEEITAAYGLQNLESLFLQLLEQTSHRRQTPILPDPLLPWIPSQHFGIFLRSFEPRR
jgi:hypothetical protein